MLDKQVTFCETEVISIGHRWKSRSKINRNWILSMSSLSAAPPFQQ